ncbi:hypothetical protein [Saccharospirillum salsuginis]|uniref:Uncharacterized protein n=1 Tax=Saccharospirillum salsuginis TaxID=418750 RepID=A0A918K5T8_9GAMM|nr:hypothetical protein [Saccharospirillum salsuginis]GGX51482.1 hypothetical protein GCM10007392_18470 [Saccharospirillum salsuginis]
MGKLSGVSYDELFHDAYFASRIELDEICRLHAINPENHPDLIHEMAEAVENGASLEKCFERIQLADEYQYLKGLKKGHFGSQTKKHTIH